MPSKHSILFPLLSLALLALATVSSLLLFYLLSLIHRPSLLWYGAAALALIALGGIIAFGVRLQRRLGSLTTFLSSASERDKPPSLPVWNEDEVGSLERGIQQLMMRQHERLRALQAEQKKLEAVLQSMAEGVVVINPAGNVVLCNRAAKELFGLRADHDWQGKPIQAFSRHPLLQDLLREVAERRPGDAPVTRELSLEGKDERHLAASSMQICEDGVTVSGYVLVFYDLTQIKRLESVRADFVANVSHELRTPLTAIKGYAETLLNGALKEPATAQRFLEIIDRHSERLSRLIDDLLTLSNLELGKTELLQEEVIVPELISEIFEVVKEKAERAGITLVHVCEPTLPPLRGDNDRLQQVLVNLVDNAIKYTQAAGQSRSQRRPSRVQSPRLQQVLVNLVDNAIKYTSSGGTVTVTAKTVQTPESGVQSPEETGDWRLETGSQSPQASSLKLSSLKRMARSRGRRYRLRHSGRRPPSSYATLLSSR